MPLEGGVSYLPPSAAARAPAGLTWTLGGPGCPLGLARRPTPSPAPRRQPARCGCHHGPYHSACSPLWCAAEAGRRPSGLRQGHTPRRGPTWSLGRQKWRGKRKGMRGRGHTTVITITISPGGRARVARATTPPVHRMHPASRLRQPPHRIIARGGSERGGLPAPQACSIPPPAHPSSSLASTDRHFPFYMICPPQTLAATLPAHLRPAAPPAAPPPLCSAAPTPVRRAGPPPPPPPAPVPAAPPPAAAAP